MVSLLLKDSQVKHVTKREIRFGAPSFVTRWKNCEVEFSEGTFLHTCIALLALVSVCYGLTRIKKLQTEHNQHRTSRLLQKRLSEYSHFAFSSTDTKVGTIRVGFDNWSERVTKRSGDKYINTSLLQMRANNYPIIAGDGRKTVPWLFVSLVQIRIILAA